MIIFSSGAIVIDQKYGWSPFKLFEELPFEEQSHLAIGDYGITVEINGKKYESISLFKLVRTNRESEDGRFHLIYIQVNVRTGEYYIGKVNRSKWKEVNKYQGSGVVFTRKYKHHSEDFIRYYIASCKSEAESRKMEADIVNEELLKDPFCLNLVKGGGGVNLRSSGKRNEKISEYMRSHPENYQKMLQKAKEIYLSDDKTVLEARNASIRKTMSSDKYRQMTSERIKNWQKEDPEGYALARSNNKKALQTDSYRKKKKASYEKWKNDNPEKYKENMKKTWSAAHAPEAEEKRSKSLKKWCDEHPEEVKKRALASAEKRGKAVNMLDLETGKVLRTFKNQQEAALWLVEQGIAKNTNCKASISSVCLKRPCTTGYGYRKKAYGFGWEFAN